MQAACDFVAELALRCWCQLAVTPPGEAADQVHRQADQAPKEAGGSSHCVDPLQGEAGAAHH